MDKINNKRLYIKPIKKINNLEDLNLFLKSIAYQRINTFIISLNESVKDKKISSISVCSEAINNLSNVLTEMINWVEEIPPIEEEMRFGNKSFITWHKKLTEKAIILLTSIIPKNLVNKNAIEELSPYFLSSFGEPKRIDYGTGHELMFIKFLCCLRYIGILNERDNAAVVFKVFVRYLKLVRLLQRTYKLEPAGSQGSWGLDDYQFAPFIFGSAQLINNRDISTTAILNKEEVINHAEEYMYFGCIRFILSMKTGDIREHSSMLYTISGVDSWEKINIGMILMFKDKVLQKFPVAQHFLFGSILSFESVNSS